MGLLCPRVSIQSHLCTCRSGRRNGRRQARTIDPAHPTSPVNLQIQIVTIAKQLEQSEQPAQPAAPGPKEPKKKR